jgi:diguanylate cyclase (GGDEF)-like protein
VLDELDSVERNRWEAEAGTLILVPIIGKSHFLGGLAGVNKIGGGDFTQQDLNLLSLFAGQVSIAIENAIAFEELGQAKRSAEVYQTELRQLNNELTAINRELNHLALYDQLTQLPNRSLLQDRLQQALFAAQREAGKVAVLIIDLDHFKEVNDTLGHDVGDQLLVQVAERFSGQLRQTDTVGRLGGDEFAVVVPDADADLASHIAGNLLAVLEPDFDIDGTRFSIAASVGIALYPAHGLDTGTLMKHADIAMYTAKRTRFGYTVYDAAKAVAPPERLRLVGDLRHALVNLEFQLYYQPKVDLRSGEIHGVEALARWPHPSRGLVPPDQFIPILEQTGLIRPFTMWAIEQGLQQCALWRESGIHLTPAINLSIHNLLDPLFPGQVISLLQRYPTCQACLVLEITESVFLSEHNKVIQVLNDLRSHGVTFSIDDFGTGHSSLSRLRNLPVSELKIDRSFVMAMENDRDDAIIVRSTIDLAPLLSHKLPLPPGEGWGEGIETM